MKPVTYDFAIEYLCTDGVCDHEVVQAIEKTVRDLRAKVAELEGEVAAYRDAGRWIRCPKCGRPTERERWCYATPLCYACLPPPEPLPIWTMGEHGEIRPAPRKD